MFDTTPPVVRLSHKNVATGELTVEVPGDYTIVQFQQRGDFTYVVLKPDPTGEGAQRAMLTKLEALNESGSELEHTAPVEVGV